MCPTLTRGWVSRVARTTSLSHMASNAAVSGVWKKPRIMQRHEIGRSRQWHQSLLGRRFVIKTSTLFVLRNFSYIPPMSQMYSC